MFALRLHGDEPRHEGRSMSVGSCGPFDKDESDTKSDYDRLSVEADALRVENRLLMRELKKMREVLRDITETLQQLTEEKQ